MNTKERQEEKNKRLEVVGRKVVYTPYHGEIEEGVVTSWNDHFIFVRYGNNTTSQATLREQLEAI